MLRIPVLVAAYLVLVALGVALGHWVTEQISFGPHHSPETDALWHGVVLVAFASYVALMATPFVPGAEVGLALLVAFGGEMALLVYLGTVLALCISFLLGRLVPERVLVRALERLRLRRAHALMSRLQSLPPARRVSSLLEGAPAGSAVRLLRWRLVAIGVALNLPGNVLIGGGGGIGMAAGMSRLCGFPGYLVTVCIAAAPVPLLVAITDTAAGTTP